MMPLDFDFPPLAWALWGAAALCLIYINTVYCSRIRRVRRIKAQCDAAEPTPADAAPWPTASVVIYARNESEALERNLPRILRQEYPGRFEVIVVNEGASEETSMVVGALKAVYPNIYLTFTPDGARSLSRKKLALTLGIKAAKGEAVLITQADVNIPSACWLAAMMEPLRNPDISIVLGYGQAAIPEQRMPGRLTRAFDLGADDAAWISAAGAGKPYRCCGYNLAYRRPIFFENKGFSRSLNLREGDDDIFLTEITTGRTAKPQLAEDAMVSREAMPFMRSTRSTRVDHAFTGRALFKTSRRLMVMGEWAIWLILGLSVAALWVAGWANWAGIAITALLVVGSWAFVGAAWHRTLTTLRVPHWRAALPFQAMTRPLRNIGINLRSRFAASPYTWSAP
ncbi:MAG: glycosyltransferase [Bacteroidales bacterium]|nr:glycosyltransferase [Bacteroidales bacterium]